MITNASDTSKILKEYLEYANIDLINFDGVYSYLLFLLEKNTELNLVSRKLDEKTIIMDHIYDCLAGFGYFKNFETITDLGSGGGFPGLLLAIVFKDKKIQLIEKSPKKVIFLQEAIKKLNLHNVTVSLNLVNNEIINSDCITARAFKSIVEILDFTKNYFNKGGLYLLYKGRMETITEEIDEAKKRFKFKKDFFKIAEKIENKERYLIRLEKI
ncbi:MAG TPA: 16S rRNA (guanine(527)-N(7))-methyltransferase RsmG [Spirochaetota bacterium]|nr:16S rRNA (guanine(527)-N(7))-methyltransferase RsmG [Spirochaetota bacterium]